MHDRPFVLRLFGMAFGALQRICRLWLWIAVIAYFTLDTVPHLRISYAYHDVYGTRYRSGCVYLGPNGSVPYTGGGHNCPAVLIMNKYGG